MTDEQIIDAGIAAGLRQDSGDAILDFYDPLGVRWLRFRAACARVELTHVTDPNIRAFLHNRACQADAEATAREAALGYLPVKGFVS